MYRFVEHTAEVELHVEAASEPEVFGEAVAAFGELVAGDGQGPGARRELELEAADSPSLLVAFLEELVYLADVEGFVPERAERLELDRGRLRARVAGRLGEAEPLVKAATYHALELAERDGRWRARVVLDV